MTKTYKTPSAEKVEFDYSESVEACSPNCKDPSHWWHWQNSCADPNANNSNPTAAPTQAPQQSSDQYYAPGWGQNC